MPNKSHTKSDSPYFMEKNHILNDLFCRCPNITNATMLIFVNNVYLYDNIGDEEIRENLCYITNRILEGIISAKIEK